MRKKVSDDDDDDDEDDDFGCMSNNWGVYSFSAVICADNKNHKGAA